MLKLIFRFSQLDNCGRTDFHVAPEDMLRYDQVIRGNPASRGTETSAEVLVGPPWRMESKCSD